MATAWLGPRRVAFIPARPDNIAAPAAWVERIQQRIFYDPTPTGDDCSLRAYLQAISYGRAQLDADVFGEVTVAPSDCGAMQDEAIRTLPSGHSYQYACVVFAPGTAGGACAGWAFYGGGPFPGTSSLGGWCYLGMEQQLGTWAMELLHATTLFGDLYNPINPAVPPPGAFDEMACACGTHPSAFTKLSMGWIDAIHVPVANAPGSATYAIHALALTQPPPAGRVAAVRVPSRVNPGRYFIVEVRLKLDRFERATDGFSSGIPSEGVVIYEIDERNPLRVWLRTPIALSVGQQYWNADERLTVDVTAAIWGGRQVAITSVEPAECVTVVGRIIEYREEVRSLANDLAAARSPAEKEAIRREMGRVEGHLRDVEAQARQLGCNVPA